MATLKRHQPQPSNLDPITALHDAIIASSEQSWEWNGVSLEERDRLRPGVAAQAKAVAAQLRAEYAMRTGAER